jgi:hypothetical protein
MEVKRKNLHVRKGVRDVVCDTRVARAQIARFVGLELKSQVFTPGFEEFAPLTFNGVKETAAKPSLSKL